MKKSLEQIRDEMADEWSSQHVSKQTCFAAFKAGFNARHKLGDEALIIALKILNNTIGCEADLLGVKKDIYEIQELMGDEK